MVPVDNLPVSQLSHPEASSPRQLSHLLASKESHPASSPTRHACRTLSVQTCKLYISEFAGVARRHWLASRQWRLGELREGSKLFQAQGFVIVTCLGLRRQCLP